MPTKSSMRYYIHDHIANDSNAFFIIIVSCYYYYYTIIITTLLLFYMYVQYLLLLHGEHLLHLQEIHTFRFGGGQRLVDIVFFAAHAGEHDRAHHIELSDLWNHTRRFDGFVVMDVLDVGPLLAIPSGSLARRCRRRLDSLEVEEEALAAGDGLHALAGGGITFDSQASPGVV